MRDPGAMAVASEGVTSDHGAADLRPQAFCGFDAGGHP
jgi:hypothetical protein